MIEQTNLSQQDYIELIEKVRNSLKKVKAALGIETEDEDSNLVEEFSASQSQYLEIKKRPSSSQELAEQKLYLTQMRAEAKKMFAENQVRFAESQAKFRSSLSKFVA